MVTFPTLQCKDHCQSLESLLENAGRGLLSATHFPTIIGNRTLSGSRTLCKQDVKRTPPPSKPYSPVSPTVEPCNVSSLFLSFCSDNLVNVPHGYRL